MILNLKVANFAHSQTLAREVRYVLSTREGSAVCVSNTDTIAGKRQDTRDFCTIF